VKADALNAINAANIYLTENPEDTNGVTVNELKTAGYLDTIGELVGTEVITDTTDGLQIDSATVITYSGAKTVTFTDATIKDINGDTAKGSDAGNREVKTP
jgi:type IV pilus assembly protein PilA